MGSIDNPTGKGRVYSPEAAMTQLMFRPTAINGAGTYADLA
jgi:hypothetical protein